MSSFANEDVQEIREQDQEDGGTSIGLDCPEEDPEFTTTPIRDAATASENEKCSTAASALVSPLPRAPERLPGPSRPANIRIAPAFPSRVEHLPEPPGVLGWCKGQKGRPLVDSTATGAEAGKLEGREE